MPESPIGSIIAFGGRLTIGFAWGGDRGTNMFNVPDLQGFFLRGVDRTEAPAQRPVDQKDERQMPSPVDPERDQRFQYRPGGAQGRWVGSVQLFATAQPRNVFMASAAGQHQHELPEINAARDVNGQRNTVAHPWDGMEKASTETAGYHEHYISGGDQETRPVNAYVHWIIRYK